MIGETSFSSFSFFASLRGGVVMSFDVNFFYTLFEIVGEKGKRFSFGLCCWVGGCWSSFAVGGMKRVFLGRWRGSVKWIEDDFG